MSAAVFIIFGIIVIPIVVMAIFLLKGKGAFLVAGYNTMSRAEKARYDEKAMCRFVGWLLIVISFCILLFPVGIYLEVMWIAFFAIAVIIFGSIGAVIYINTGNRFQKKASSKTSYAKTADAQKSKVGRAVIIVTVVVSAVVLIAVGVMLYQGAKDPKVHISDNLIIEAMYGVSVEFSDITDITLIKTSMADIGFGKRTNGYGGIGKTLKGHFLAANGDETLLFVQSQSSPTIRIERNGGKDIYISFRDGGETERLFYELHAAVTRS